MNVVLLVAYAEIFLVTMPSAFIFIISIMYENQIIELWNITFALLAWILKITFIVGPEYTFPSIESLSSAASFIFIGSRHWSESSDELLEILWMDRHNFANPRRRKRVGIETSIWSIGANITTSPRGFFSAVPTQ